jgi:hypothetical protein
MGLSEIAADLEVTARQEQRGVATVDDTDATLVERLAVGAESLPCTPEAAATVLRRHAAGDPVGEAAREAGVAPMTAAKALYACGVAGVCPLAPTARAVVADWVAGDLRRSEALELTGADEAEFALAAYVETHDPDPDLAAAAADALSPGGDAAVEKRDRLAETLPDVG